MRRSVLVVAALAVCSAAVPAPAAAGEFVPAIGAGTLAGRVGTALAGIRNKPEVGYGPHLLLSLGGSPNPYLSLHGQVQGLYVRYGGLPSGVDSVGGWTSLGFAGFLRLKGVAPRLPVDVLVGPNFGFYGYFWNVDDHVVAVSGQTYGLHLGFAVAAFYPMSKRVAGGLYLQYMRLFSLRQCYKAADDDSVCDSSPDSKDDGLFSIGAALML